MRGRVYELIMAALALAVAAILFIEYTRTLTKEQEKLLTNIDLSILAIFAVDYFYRLVKSEKKWIFFKSNIFDLIAIIPFDKTFRIARLARLVKLSRFSRLSRIVRLSKLVRLLLFLRKLGPTVKGIATTNGLIYVILVTSIIIVCGAFGIMTFEASIDSFGDALWWSLVTTTTVGYGDISPASTGGRILAAFLMLLGIGFLGMVTGSIATYFVDKLSRSKKGNTVYNEQLDYLKKKLDELEHLSYEDVKSLNRITIELWKQIFQKEMK